MFKDYCKTKKIKFYNKVITVFRYISAAITKNYLRKAKIFVSFKWALNLLKKTLMYKLTILSKKGKNS